jgi:hypothetical protein
MTEIFDVQILEVCLGSEAIHSCAMGHGGAVDAQRACNSALGSLVCKSDHDVVAIST